MMSSLAGKSSISLVTAALYWLPQEGADPIALQGGDFVADAAAVLLRPPPVSDHAERPTTVIAFVYCRHGTLGTRSVRSRTQNF
jgi:hypothetical protein